MGNKILVGSSKLQIFKLYEHLYKYSTASIKQDERQVSEESFQPTQRL